MSGLQMLAWVILAWVGVMMFVLCLIVLAYNLERWNTHRENNRWARDNVDLEWIRQWREREESLDIPYDESYAISPRHLQVVPLREDDTPGE